MAQRLRIRWRSRWRPPTTNHPPFPQEAASSDGAVPHPAFVTHVKPARKRLKVVSLPWAGQPVATSQPPPSWKAAQILKRRSTAYDTLKSGDAALAASAPPAPVLTAQGYPAWLPPAAIKRKPTRFTKQPTLLNEYPETPAAPSAESYPAWLPPKLLKRQPTYRTHMAGAGDTDAAVLPTPTPAVYPSFIRLTAIRRPRMRFEAQSTPLVEFPETVTSSSDSGTTPTFVTRYSKARRLQRPIYPPVYPEAGGEEPTAEGYPAWLLKQAIDRRATRFDIKTVSLAEFPETPVSLTAQGYPGWLPPKHHRTTPTYRTHDSGSGYVPANPAQPRLDAPKAIARRKTERRHLTAAFPPVYPQTPALTAQGYPAWLHKRAIERASLRVDHQSQPFAPVYPATPVVADAQGYPAWALNQAIRRSESRFDVQRAPHPPVYPQPVQAPTEAAYRAKQSIRRPSLDIHHQWQGYPPVYPPKTAQNYPSWQLRLAIRRAALGLDHLTPPHPAEYPEPPPQTIARVVPLTGVFDIEIPLTGLWDTDEDVSGSFDTEVPLSGEGDPV